MSIGPPPVVVAPATEAAAPPPDQPRALAWAPLLLVLVLALLAAEEDASPSSLAATAALWGGGAAASGSRGGDTLAMTCAPLPTDSGGEDGWALELCAGGGSSAATGAAEMRGHFIARQERTCDEASGWISLDAALAAEVRRSMGPHELHLIIEGVETRWLEQEHLGRCTYRFPFRIAVAAPRHRLRLVQTRRDFWGFNEVNVSALPLNDVVVIADCIFFSLPLPWPAASRPTLADAEAASLPECTQSTEDARFVATDAGVLDGEPILLQSDLPAAKYFVNLHLPTAAHWRPFDCAVPYVSPADFQSRLEGKRVDFAGDSHARVFFNHVLRTYCGVENAASKGWGNSQCLGFGEMPLCPRLSFCLLYAPYMEMGVGDGHGASRDALVISFGNHPAAGSHWALRKFEERMAEVLGRFAGGGGEGDTGPRPQVLLLSQMPIPFSTGEYVRRYADTRTFMRMQLFERAARRAAAPFVARGAVEYVSAFALAMTAIGWSTDQSHLIGSDAGLDGVADMILLHLGRKDGARGRTLLNATEVDEIDRAR
jgi:hypothetical protein